MPPRLIPLFQRGDPVEHAFLVQNGPVYVEMPGLNPAQLPGENLVVGTLELFLQDLQPRNPERLFKVSVTKDDVVRKVEPKAVLDLLIDYDFGFHTNCFLAQLLELSNQAHLTMSQRLTVGIRKYKVRGIHFAHLVDELRELSAVATLKDLLPLVKESEKSAFYKDGCMFSREHTFRSVNVAPEMYTEVVHVHRKNSAICREGGLSDSMFVLLDGKVAVTVEGRYIASIEQPGEAFGEVSLFLSGRRSATLIAEKDTTIFVLRREMLPKFYRRHRDVFHNIASTLARRVHDNIERVVRFTSLLESADAVEQQSWKDLRSFHDRVLELQRKLSSETLQRTLSKHSVV